MANTSATYTPMQVLLRAVGHMAAASPSASRGPLPQCSMCIVAAVASHTRTSDQTGLKALLRRTGQCSCTSSVASGCHPSLTCMRDCFMIRPRRWPLSGAGSVGPALPSPRRTRAPASPGWTWKPRPSHKRSQSAEATGTDDRIRFEVLDAAHPELRSQFDLVTAVETLHEMAHPPEALGNACAAAAAA